MKDNKKMPSLTLKNIAKACNGIYVGALELQEQEICGAVIDSRLVEQDYLFIPIKGERVDGHKFIPQVFEKGALCVLSEMDLENPGGPYIKVDSTELALKQIASFYRQQLSIRVVGITGSVGKTSTKEMISSVISQKYKVHKTAGNFNNEIGLPLTIFGIRSEHEVAVLEMGISDFNEMHRLSEIANPDICVITNIGLCHLENLGTRDGVLQAKTECFAHMKEGGVAILNGDDDKLATQREVNGKSAVFYGFGSGVASLENGINDEVTNVVEYSICTENEYDSLCYTQKSIYATDIKNHGFEGMSAKVHTQKGSFDVTISIPGEHNVYNALAATAVGLELGLELEEIQKGIEEAKTIAGRTNVLKIKGMQVIDDCYNANPVSMEAALDVLSHASGRTIAVLGDMGELGENEKELHYGVGRVAGEKRIDTLFCAGILAKEYEKSAKMVNSDIKVFYFVDKNDMINALLRYVKTGDSILIKASHFMDFSKVVEALKR